jgi:hypothetical protein
MTRSVVRLGDFVTVTKGVSYRAVDLRPGVGLLLSLKCFSRDGSFDGTGLKEYSGTFKPSQQVRPGDVVVAQTDLTQGGLVVGRALRVPDLADSAVVVASLDACIVRSTRSELVQAFLPLALQDERFREHCRAHANGTTVLHLPTGSIETYEFELPSIEEQISIVGMIGSIDQKTESNVHLSSQAVAFLGPWYRSIATERRRVGDLFELHRGFSYSGAMLAEAGVPMLNLANFGIDGELKAEEFKYLNVEPPASRSANAWDLLIANTDLTQERRILGRAVVMPLLPDVPQYTFSHHVFRIVPDESAAPDSPLVAYLAMRQPRYVEWVRACATGTTVAAVRARDVLSFELDWPDTVHFAQAAALVRRTLELVWSLRRELKDLRRVRQMVLAGLLAGRISIRDAI